MMQNDAALSLKVLVVDDSDFIHAVFKQHLPSAGLNTVLEARSGREAFDLLSRPDHGVDLAFCDLLMPGMDGLTLVGRLATLPAPPAIVLISSSDEGLLQIVERTATDQGLRVLGIIKKPVTRDAVDAMLARFLEPQ